jgi:hypothetical protein
MRAPGLGSCWSRARVTRRSRYADYIQWRAGWRTERPARCQRRRRGERRTTRRLHPPWLLDRDDLHHTTHDRLGHERLADLIPIRRPCHTRLHDVRDTSPAWRKLGQAQATVGIIAALRRDHHGAMNV